MRLGTIAVIAAVALAGCGGDEATDSPNQAAAATATTGGARATFVAEADAICAKANAKEVDLGAEGSGWIYGEQFDDAAFLEHFNDAGRVARRELAQLTPPAEDRESMATMLDSIARIVKALDSRIAGLRDGRDESRAVNAYVSGYADLVTAAGALGLTECQGLLL